MSSFAEALHDALDDPMCAEPYPPEAGSHVEHALSDEWWERTAEDVLAYVRAMVRSEMPPWIAHLIGSHRFGPCSACGARATDSDILQECEG